MNGAPEFKQPESSVVQFPFPTRPEDLREVHMAELDKRFGKLIGLFEKTKTFHLNRGRYHDLEAHIVTKGGISSAVFEEYLKRKGFTWDRVSPQVN